MIECSHKIEQNFDYLSKELKEIKKDVGDWQRREQDSD